MDANLQANSGLTTSEHWNALAGTLPPQHFAVEEQEERVYWNEADGIVVKKSEYGGVLPRDWEANRDKLAARFYFPDGNSLTWDVCARDRLRDFNMVCLKCGDCFVCAPNNMTRTGNRHIRSKHPTLRCIDSPVPFYKVRAGDPKPVESNRMQMLPTVSASLTDESVAGNSRINVSSISGSGIGGVEVGGVLPAESAQFPEVLSVQHTLAPVSYLPIRPRIQRCSELDRRRLDRYLASVLSRCQLPSSVLDNPVFREMLEELTSLEYLPADSRVADREYDKMYKGMLIDFRSEFVKLGANSYYAVSADCWPTQRGDSCVVVVTLYSLDHQWRHLQGTIGARTVSTSKVAAAILDVFIETFHKELGLPPDRISSIVVNHFKQNKAWKLSKDYPLFHYQTRCPIYVVQTALKECLAQLDVVCLLQKIASLLGYIHANSSIQYILSELCVDDEAQCFLDLLPEGNRLPDIRMDSEHLMLWMVYRLRHVLTLAWKSHKIPSAVVISRGGDALSPVETSEVKFEILDVEWDVIGQLLAVFSRIESFNAALGKYQTVPVSKVYPAVLSLYRFLVQEDLVGLDFKRWAPGGVHDSVRRLKQFLAAALVEDFPGVGCTSPIDSWKPEDKQLIEPYLIAIALDPSLCNSFVMFSNPLLSSDINGEIVSSIVQHARKVVEKVGIRVRSQWLYTRHDQLTHSSSLGPHHVMPEVVPTMNFDSSSQYDESFRDFKPLEVECQQYFAETTHSFDPTLQPMPPSAVVLGELPEFQSTRQIWQDSGGWDVHQKSPELLWWERNQSRFLWMSRLAMIFLAMPSSSLHPNRLNPATCMGVVPMVPDNASLQSILLRENFYLGMLEVSNADVYKKRRRTNSGIANEVESVSRHSGKFLARHRSFTESLYNDASDSLRRDTKCLHVIGKRLPYLSRFTLESTSNYSHSGSSSLHLSESSYQQDLDGVNRSLREPTYDISESRQRLQQNLAKILLHLKNSLDICRHMYCDGMSDYFQSPI